MFGSNKQLYHPHLNLLAWIGMECIGGLEILRVIFIHFMTVLMSAPLVYFPIIVPPVLKGFIWIMLGVWRSVRNKQIINQNKMKEIRRCASRKKCTRMGFVMSTAAENARTVCRPRVTVASALSFTPEMKMESASSRVM
jgi:hypothetical protein